MNMSLNVNWEFLQKLRNDYWRLSLLVFLTGTVVMSLELVGSRLLIPVFGGSIFTWGSLIGVILSGLSIGYIIGGKLADSNPSFRKFCSLVFSAGLFIVLIPFIAPTALEFSSSILTGSSYAPILGAIPLLLFPNILLGTVSPYAVKIGTKTLHNLGNVSGNLYFFAAIGSIFGTFFTTFVLIEQFEVRQILFGLGLVLIVSSLLGLPKIPKIATIIIFFLIYLPASSLVLVAFSHSGDLVYEKETPYSHLEVIDTQIYRSLVLDGLVHSKMSKDNPDDLVIRYTKYFHLGMLAKPDAQDVLFVGGGGFSGPKNFLKSYPGINVDVVEIDPNVIEAAKEYFNVEPNPQLRIINEDARVFLSNSEKQYDVIILDAYAKDFVPFHLLTKEYFLLLDEHLKPNGIIISNILTSLVGDTSDLFRAIYKTMAEVYPTIYVYPTTDKLPSIRNTMIVAFNENLLNTQEQLSNLLVENDVKGYLAGQYIQKSELKIKTDDVPILTDQFSPVERFLNPVTSKLLVIEEQSVRASQSFSWSEHTYITIFLLFLMGVYWIIQMRQIWKKEIQT